MASQLVSDVRCQRLKHYAASYGERGSNGGNTTCTLSRRQSFGYHRIGKSRGIHPEDNNFRENNKLGTKLARQQAQKLHRLGFSYLASSVIYIVTKVKAFYNGFLGDVASDSRMGIGEAPMAEAYFSVPVLPN